MIRHQLLQYSATSAGRHLPLDGGGWEGVLMPQYEGEPTPTLTLPARGRVSTDRSATLFDGYCYD